MTGSSISSTLTKRPGSRQRKAMRKRCRNGLVNDKRGGALLEYNRNKYRDEIRAVQSRANAEDRQRKLLENEFVFLQAEEEDEPETKPWPKLSIPEPEPGPPTRRRFNLPSVVYDDEDEEEYIPKPSSNPRKHFLPGFIAPDTSTSLNKLSFYMRTLRLPPGASRHELREVSKFRCNINLFQSRFGQEGINQHDLINVVDVYEKSHSLRNDPEISTSIDSLQQQLIPDLQSITICWPLMTDTSEPVFKKRRRGPAASVGDGSNAPALRGLLSSNPADGEEATASTKDNPENATDGEDDEGTSVQDLILLRQLHKRPTGIELDKLNQGEKKKKKKKTAANEQAGKSADQKWADQMAKGGLMNGAHGNDEEDNDEQDQAGGPKKIVRNNFQGESNIVDVDKHMMAYIEEEMNKRSGREGGNAPSADRVRAALNNPEDELYQVAEKYRSLQRQKPTEEEEGNVTLSTTMLTSIPEIDLGMDVRLKNIEETEKAKHILAEQRRAAGGRRDEGDDQFAAARFYRPKYSTQSDLDALNMAREGLDPTAEINRPDRAGGRPGQSSRAAGGERRATATDELVMERFKKRQRQHLK